MNKENILRQLSYNSYTSKQKNKLVFIFFSIYFSIGILRATNISFAYWSRIEQSIQMLMLILILFTSVIYFLANNIKPKPIALLMLLGGVGNFIITKHTFILGFTISILGFSNVNFPKLLKQYLIVLNITFFFIVLCSIIGIIPIGTATRGDIVRYNLGFQTSTLPATIFFFISLGHIYLYKRKTSIIYLLYVVTLSTVIFALTNTRTCYFLTLFTAFICLLDKLFKFSDGYKKHHHNAFISLLISCFPFIILILEFAAVLYYSSGTDLAYKLDSIFSTRLSLTWNLLDSEGLSLFGKSIPSNVNGYYYQSDICYFYYGLNYGILTLLLTLLMEFAMIKKAIKESDLWLLFVALIIIIDGIVEPYLLDYKYQIFTFILVDSFFFKKKNSTIIIKEI